MAIYHLTAQIIGRSSGRSVIAAAAYRSATCLYSEYDGRTSDYTKKNWVIHSEIVLPETAPTDFVQRENLWNAVERIEKSSTCQLAREFEIALPKELTLEDQLQMVREFVNRNFISKGLCVDFSIHNPPLRNDYNQPITKDGIPTSDASEMEFPNPHVHILVPMRPLNSDGEFEYKSQAEYICKKGDEEKSFTALELKQCKSEGWEKQYQYQKEKKKVWLTPTEAERENLKRLKRTPKTTAYGRVNPVIEYLSKKESLMQWRKSWQDIVNSKMKDLEIDTRIDCRSYKEQGRVEEIPSVHMGVEATCMERRACRQLQEGVPETQITRSYIGDMNRDIKQHNMILKELKRAITTLYKQTKDVVKSIAQQLEGIRAQLIGYNYQKSFLNKRKHLYHTILKNQCDDITNKDCTNAELIEHEKYQNAYEKVESSICKIIQTTDELSVKYKHIENDIPKEQFSEIQEYRQMIRSNLEDAVRDKLVKNYGSQFDKKEYKRTIFNVDKMLQIRRERKSVSKKEIRER